MELTNRASFLLVFVVSMWCELSVEFVCALLRILECDWEIVGLGFSIGKPFDR